MNTRRNAIVASDGTTMGASRRRPSRRHVVNHDTRQSSARNAAMTLAETRDLAPGQKWRMAWTNGGRTSLVDVPYAAAWVAMAWIQILRLFGRDVEMLDWSKMPDRIRFGKPGTAKSDSLILSERTADLLWANRHSLRIQGTPYGMDRDRSDVEIQFAEGVKLSISTRLEETANLEGPHQGRTNHYFTIHAAGREAGVEHVDAAPLTQVWEAIICQSFLDAMEPGRTTVERRSPHADIACEALCRYVEVHCAPKQEVTFEKDIGEYKKRMVKMQSEWRELPNGALYRHSKTDYYNVPVILISDGRTGMMSVDVESVIAAADRRSLHAVECAIASTPPLMPGPSITGSPKAALMMRLLEDSLKQWPDLQDAKGTPIEPLLSSHLPRLVNAYMEECRIPGADRKAAEAVLDQGLERIGDALGEALNMRRNTRRNDLRTEVAFLMSRHPQEAIGIVGKEGEVQDGGKFSSTSDL